MTSGMVTGIVTAYNYEAIIGEALKSAIRSLQEVGGDLVVVDDASSDRTAAVIAEILRTAPIPTRLIVHEENLGLPRSLNDAIDVARGAYVALLDGDDIWEAGNLTRHLEMFEKDPDTVVVYGDASVVGPDGTSEISTSFMRAYRDEPPTAEPDLFQTLLLELNFIPVSATTISRSAIVSCGGFDESLRFQDYDLWLRLSRTGGFRFSGARDARMRQLEGSMSRTIGSRLFKDYLTIWRKHFSETPLQWRPHLRSNVTHAALGITADYGWKTALHEVRAFEEAALTRTFLRVAARHQVSQLRRKMVR